MATCAMTDDAFPSLHAAVAARYHDRGTTMGLMPAGSENPFTKVDQRTILGVFKSGASHDPDVLYAQKEGLLGPTKNLKRLAVLSGVLGAFFTISIFMAWFGIPLLLGAWWLWRFQAKNTEAVEAAYAEYVASVRVEPGGPRLAH